MSTIIDETFEALFFGTGSWLGILLYLAIVIALLKTHEYTGALLLPITVFIGIEYLGKDMGWHSLIMFIASAFILIYVARQLRRR